MKHALTIAASAWLALWASMSALIAQDAVRRASVGNAPRLLRAAVLADEITGLNPQVVDKAKNICAAAGCTVSLLKCDQLADATVFSVKKFDLLVLPHSPAFPLAAEQVLSQFLRGGGDLVLLGGHAFQLPLWKFRDRWRTKPEILQATGSERLPKELEDRDIRFYGAFEDYDVYRMDGVCTFASGAEQDVFKEAFPLRGSFRGVSAVGFGLPGEARYVPVLAVLDPYGRRRGWAAGVHVNYAGPYAGSYWALFGIQDDAFYLSEDFGRLFGAMLLRFRDDALKDWARAADAREVKAQIEAPRASPGSLRIGPDRKNFVRADGKPVFLIGCNYHGNLQRKYNAAIPGELERDFQRLQAIGVNAIRIWGFPMFLNAEGGVENLKRCARKYGVYYMPVLARGGEASRDELEKAAREIAAATHDDPMLLAYDLVNEPYFWELGRIKDRDGRTLAQEHPFPKGMGWAQYEAFARTGHKGFCSAFPGVTGPLPLPKDPQLRQVFESVDGIYGSYLGWLRDAAREAGPEALFTAGYNTVWGCMPTNKPLDFVSNHAYQPPAGYESVLRNLQVMDTLHAVWPDRPITLGEFGYSGGDKGVDGRLLDVHNIAVGEFMHYLYALTHGCAGVFKWILYDDSRWTCFRTKPWIPWEEQEKHVQQARFGVFYDDGSNEAGCKPLGAALRFLRDYLDAGNRQGQIEVRRAVTAIGAGYVFRGRDALFVGDVAYQAPTFSFSAEHPANVLLWWSDDCVRLLSTADAKVRLDVAAFAPRIGARRAGIEGRRRHDAFEGGQLVVETLAGERVTIRSDNRRPNAE